MPSKLQELIDDYVWRLVKVKGPGWCTNPIFDMVLGTRESFEEICTSTPLSFAPNLLNVLKSPTPPPLRFFQTLPKPMGKFWGVYVVLLTKRGHKSKLYVGSGTEVEYGYLGRLSKYSVDKISKKMRRRKLSSSLPRFVARAYRNGYTLDHAGLLCWTAIPPPERVPRGRVRVVAVEAVFASIFYAAFKTIIDPLWTDFMPWDRDDVSWDPLCSHSALKETVAGDFDLSSEQLIAMAAARKLRLRERKAKEKRIWTARNSKRAADTHAKSIAKARASKKHHCDVCDLTFPSASLLKIHLDTKAHANKVAGKRSKPSANTLRSRAFTEKTKANKRFHCELCDLSFPSQAKLTTHNGTKRHLAKEKEASAGASLT